MYTRKELSKILGLSYKQLRTRLDHLARQGDLLAGQVGKGRNGRLEYKPAVIDLLRELAPLADEAGKDHGQAARELAESIQAQKVADGQGHTGKAGNFGQPETGEWVRELIAEKDRRIADLEADRDHWRDLALEFKRQLPAPREARPRRSWISRLLHPVAASNP